MKTIVTDIDTERPGDDEHYTIYFRQGQLTGTMLLRQDDIEDNTSDLVKAAQDYVESHEAEIPKLKVLPNLDEVGQVTKYLVQESQDSRSGMVFIEKDDEDVESLVAELHEADKSIETFEDVANSLASDFQRFPYLRDYIEFSRPDEYVSGEPLIQCYTGLASVFASNVVQTKFR